MRAVIYDEFEKIPTIEDVPDPTPDEHGVVLRVKATGLCRSDWHGCVGIAPNVCQETIKFVTTNSSLDLPIGDLLLNLSLSTMPISIWWACLMSSIMSLQRVWGADL